MMNKLRLERRIMLVGGIVFGLSAVAFAHITPTVIMEKRADVIKNSLPSATSFFVRDIRIGQNDYSEIEAKWNFLPDITGLKFYYGKDAAGRIVGTVLFDQVNTIHGPIEVGIAFTPEGAVSNVVVTKATVETEPWVRTALREGLTRNFIGLNGKSSLDPLKRVSKSAMGAMPYFMAQVITTAVIRGIIYYTVLFQPHLPS